MWCERLVHRDIPSQRGRSREGDIFAAPVAPLQVAASSPREASLLSQTGTVGAVQTVLPGTAA